MLINLFLDMDTMRAGLFASAPTPVEGTIVQISDGGHLRNASGQRGGCGGILLDKPFPRSTGHSYYDLGAGRPFHKLHLVIDRTTDRTKVTVLFPIAMGSPWL